MSHGLALDRAAWSSPWRSRSVRDKGVLSLGLLVAAVSLPPLPGDAAIVVVCLALLLGPIDVGAARLGRVLWLPLVSIAIGVATVAVSVSWDAGVRLAVTPEGTAMAGHLAVRALAAVLAMFTLACSTPMVDLFSACRRARVPAPLVEIAALVYRFTFGLLESAYAVRDAQGARLGMVNRRTTMRSAGMGASALFLRAWDRARRLEEGLTGRGYTDTLVTLERPRRRSGAFLALSVAGLATLVAVSVAWEVVR